ncbi:MAG: F0F1 ATP synthase subunit A [Parvularculaceae bacterium]
MTLALALVSISIVIVYGFYKNGLGFLKLFVPSGVPAWLLPLIVLIEFVSSLSRPLSLAIRLFANMLAGHIISALCRSFRSLLAASSAQYRYLFGL